MTRSKAHWIPLTTLALAAATLAACGSAGPTSSSGSGSTPTPTASAPNATPTPTFALPTTTAASSSCPSGATVSSALSTPALPNATGIVGGGTNPLPAGASGIVCEYNAVGVNVIIEVVVNIPASYISEYSTHFPAKFKSVSGVGDQARSFVDSLGAGRTNEGIVATKGSTLVALVATDTPATLSQIEAFVNQLL